MIKKVGSLSFSVFLLFTLVLLLATCSFPWSDTTDPPVYVPNTAPRAIAGNNIFALVNEVINFDASDSTDEDGDLLTYTWSFGDGSEPGSGVRVSHRYTEENIYTVSLTARDDEGGTSTDEIYVLVEASVNSSPVAGIVNDKILEVQSGDIIVFDGGYSYDPDGDTFTYSWDFGDDSLAGTAVAAPHSYTDGGTYLVTLTVTDDDGNTNEDNVVVYVNAPPVAAISSPVNSIEVNTQETVNFDGSNSYDPDNDEISYSWDFGDETGSDLSEPAHSYINSGLYTVSLTVTDSSGIENTSAIEIDVLNQLPELIAGENIYCEVDTAFSLSPFRAVDPDGTIESYFWSITDSIGTEVDSSSMDAYSSSLSIAGVYDAVITITDDVGDSVSDSLIIIVADLSTPDVEAPVGVFTPPEEDPDVAEALAQELVTIVTPVINTKLGSLKSGSVVTAVDSQKISLLKSAVVVEKSASIETATPPTRIYVLQGRPVLLDASKSYDPGGLQTAGDGYMTYSWDFGDGSVLVTDDLDGLEVHVFDTPGDYNVTVSITDDDGTLLAEDLIIPITVLAPPNKAPVADAGENIVAWIADGETEVTVNFNGSGSFDPDMDGSIVSYEWDFDDGSNFGTGASPVKTYTEPGIYLITLTVMDGGSVYTPKYDSDSLVVTVKKEIVNHAPIANAGSSVTIITNEPSDFSGLNSFDPDIGDSISDYTWNMGNGVTKTGESFNYSYAVAGDYTVLLTVRDEEGLEGTAEIVISVIEPPPVAFRFEISYTGSNQFDENAPLTMLIYDRTNEDWLQNGLAAEKSIINSGSYIIKTGDFNDGFSFSPDTSYSMLLFHDLTGSGNAEGNYWGLYMNGSVGNMSFNIDNYTPVTIDADNPITYSVTFTDTNNADIEVNIW